MPPLLAGHTGVGHGHMGNATGPGKFGCVGANAWKLLQAMMRERYLGIQRRLSVFKFVHLGPIPVAKGQNNAAHRAPGPLFRTIKDALRDVA